MTLISEANTEANNLSELYWLFSD